MPRANVYIHVDDFEKWQTIPNKSDWIHKQLNS